MNMSLVSSVTQFAYEYSHVYINYKNTNFKSIIKLWGNKEEGGAGMSHLE